MTGMLASVRNLEEAKMVYQGGADIIDIKEPNEGALGAVPLSQIHHVVDCLLYTSPSPRDLSTSRMPSSA